MITLRENQIQGIHDARRSVAAGNRKIVLVAPTGAGKTVVGAQIIRNVVEKGKTALFLAHRRELVKQAEAKLFEFGVDNGVIMAGEELMDYDVQVASIDTLRARAMKTDRMRLPRADVIMIDECFTGDVEILTESGFIRLDALEDGVRVAQVSESGRPSFVLPKRVIRNRYVGDMITMKSPKNIDITVTPNHEMVVRSRGESGYRKRVARKISAAWFMPVAPWGRDYEIETLSARDRLAIALQADGSLRRGGASGLDFHFVKDRKIDRLAEICASGGYDMREVKGSRGRRRFIVYGSGLSSKDISAHFDLPGISQGRAAAIIEEMVCWDGHICASGGGYHFSSVDESATDFYQAVAILAGYRANKTLQVDARKRSYRDVHRLFITRHNHEISTQSIYRGAAPFDGTVYCVEVPDGMIVVRRNGKPLVTGNCHRSLAPTYMKLIEAYPDSIVIGLTATPVRGDGKGLGHVYDDMVCLPGVAELTQQGFLVPARYFAPTIPDLTGVKTVRGDYDQRQLAEAMDKRKPVGDVIENWARICPDRKTIVFASGVKHSIHLRDEFVRAGISAVHIDGEMQRHERDDAIAGLRAGKYQVVVNCMVLTEGFDMPELSCCVMVRPTKNPGLYLQMAGRVLRPFEGKDDTIIIDHSGNVYAHGHVADEREWSLDIDEPYIHDKKKAEIKAAKQITCVQCAHIYSGQRQCPHCGHIPQMKGQAIETRHAVLTEVKDGPAQKKQYTMFEKQEWYSMLRGYAVGHGKSDGWVAHSYKAKFGVWPRGMSDDGVDPSLEVLGFIRHRNIAYAKRKQKEQAAQAIGGTDDRRGDARKVHRSMEVRS